MGERDSRSATLTNFNANILGVVRWDVSSDDLWNFFCECGRADCHEHVSLTIVAYGALRDQDGDGTVLAPGHELSHAERARREALRLRDDATALRAQAELQMAGAQQERSYAGRHS